ncbi:MAG: hypothetical protein IT163_09875 [Bryobacterales bacterium]|nr:hypothetical protein [Bryobacterales bacterium]
MTLGQLKARTFQRLDAPADGTGYYSVADVVAALNDALLLFVYLTLCLEETRSLELAPNTRFYRLLDRWDDFILPLRVRHTNLNPGDQDALFDQELFDSYLFGEGSIPGWAASLITKLRPARLQDLRALDRAWMTAAGTPDRYAFAGVDVMTFDRIPSTVGQTVYITMARAAAPLAGDADAPEIPASHHEALIDFAVFWLRAKEGGSEFLSALGGLARFFDSARQLAAFVRARSLALRYDHVPSELERFDLSRLLKVRTDLPPHRREVAPSLSK